LTDCIIGELIILNVRGWSLISGGNASTYLGFFADGSAIDTISANGVRSVDSKSSDQASLLAFSEPFVATGTSHTFTLRAGKDPAGTLVLKTGFQIDTLRQRGGFVQPENIPRLEYSTADVAQVTALPGAASDLKIILSDGIRRSATSPLSIDLTTTGLGGLDTGARTNDTWYAVFAVPSSTDGQFDVVASINSPTTGPTGFSSWSYLGRIRNGTAAIRKFAYVGNWYYSDNEFSTDQEVLNTTTPTMGAWTALTLTTAVPSGGYDALEIDGHVLGQSGDFVAFHVEPSTPTYSPTVDNASNGARAFLFTQNNSVNESRRVVPVTGGLSYFGFLRAGSSPHFDQLVIRVTGFRDKFLISPVGPTTSLSTQEPTIFARAVGNDATFATVSFTGTTGNRFVVLKPGKIVGIRWSTVVAGAHTIDLKLWNALTGSQLALVTVSPSGTLVDQTAFFSSPIVVAESDVGLTQYAVTMREGTFSSEVATTPFIDSSNHFTLGNYMTIRGSNWFVAGDANPTGNAGSKAFPIDPIIIID
jgi:hypothetical protein